MSNKSMYKDINNTFLEKIIECQKHIKKIKTAKKHLVSIMPLTVDSYHNLSEIDESFIDQLIYRFSKLQDTLGEKIFPSLLILSKENVKQKTFIDILNRLEELEVVDKNNWLILREIRNDIAHEYSFNTDEVINSISLIFQESDNLLTVFQKVMDFCLKRYQFLDLSQLDIK